MGSKGHEAVIYFRAGGELHHWVISCDPEKDSIDTLRQRLAIWIPSAEFVEARIEKFSLATADEMSHFIAAHQALELLVNDAVRLETADGHLVSKSDGTWYAYPKLDPQSLVEVGGVVLKDGQSGYPIEFRSALAAHQACVDARKKASSDAR